MEFYAEQASPPVNGPPGGWWTLPSATSRKSPEGSAKPSAVTTYLRSLLSSKPMPRVSSRPHLTVRTMSLSNIIELMDSSWWGTTVQDDDDSPTPSSRGSAGSFEADFLPVPTLAGGATASQGPAPRLPGRVPSSSGRGPAASAPPAAAKPPLPRAGSGFSRADSSRARGNSRDTSRTSSMTRSGHGEGGAAAAAGLGPAGGPPLRSDSGGGGLLRRLGTWAERVTMFGKSAPESIQSTPAAGALEEAASSVLADGPEEAPQSPPTATASGSGRRKVQLAGVEEEDDGDADVENVRRQAWRWRFTKRWQQEQAKQFDPDFGKQGADEEWDEALGYLNACKDGVHFQPTSDLEVGTLSGAQSLNSNVLLMGESHHEGGGLNRHPQPDATKQVAQVAKRARDLAAHQKQIDRHIDDEWGRARKTGARWVGDEIDMVEVDLEGRCTFVLASVSDANRGLSLQVLRAHARSTVPELLQAIHFEVVSSCGHGKQSPMPAITHLGSGTLEWSPDKRVPRLEVLEAKRVSPGDPKLKTGSDVARQAGTLLVSALPKHYRIMVEGARVT